MRRVRYVVGFAFTPDLRSVLLLRKLKPAWQRGRLNGVGGHVEEDESFAAAMVREFEEETGLVVIEDAWRLCVTYRGPDYDLHVFSTITDTIHKARQTTAEEPVLLPIEDLRREATLPNLQWMIPLCLDDAITFPVEVQE